MTLKKSCSEGLVSGREGKVMGMFFPLEENTLFLGLSVAQKRQFWASHQ